MRTLFATLLALALVAAACGDDDGGVADPASINSCADVATAGLDIVKDAIKVIENMSAEELAALATSDETPEQFRPAEEGARVLQARAAALGCSDEEIGRLMSAKAETLSTDNLFAQFIIEGIKAGEGFSLLGE